jgi:hypothetical protein
MVSAVADADFEIQSLHHNWRFMWRQFRSTLQIGQDFLATPKTFSVTPPAGYVNKTYSLKKVDRTSLCINYTNQSQAYRPTFLPWREFEMLWQSRGAKFSSDNPANWTLDPAGHPLLSHSSVTGLPYQYECWVRPRRMRDDGDISPLVEVLANNQSDTTQIASNLYQPPSTLNSPSTNQSLMDLAPSATNSTAIATARYESCRIIVIRAALIYFNVEGATDLIQAALAEYQDLLEELRADQLPDMEHDRVSTSDVPLVMVSD